MRFLTIFAAVIGVLTLGLGLAQAQTPAPAPDWVAKPTGDDISEAYPDVARALGVEGHVMISCIVGLSGYVTGCSVVEEQPTGYGFGAAALKISSRFQMTPSDGRVNIPITFKLPPDAPHGVLGGIAVALGGLATIIVAAGLNDLIRGRKHLKISVIATLQFVLEFIGRAWRGVPAPLALSCVPIVVSAFRHGTPTAADAYGWTIYSFVVAIITQGALIRLGLTDLRPEDSDLQPALWGLRAGKTERRLATVSLISMVGIGLGVLGLALIAAVATPALLALHPSPAARTELAVGASVTAVAGVLFVAVRLMTWLPTAVFAKTVDFRGAWASTKATVLGPYVVLAALFLAGMTLLTFWGAILGGLIGHFAGEATVRILVSLVVAVAVGLWIPASTGVSIYMFRTLHPFGKAGTG